MITRIEKSQKEEKKEEGKENKAARKLPQEVLERIRIQDSLKEKSTIIKNH